MSTLKQHKDCFQCLAISDEQSFFEEKAEHVCVLGYRVMIVDRKISGSLLLRMSKPLEQCQKPLKIEEFT